MQLNDMGYKSESPSAVSVSDEGKSKVRYPTFSLSKSIPDDLMAKEMGKMVRLEIVARVTGKSIDTYSEREDRRMEFEIVKLGVIGDAGKKTKDEYLKMDDDQREDYDKKQVMNEEEGDNEE